MIFVFWLWTCLTALAQQQDPTVLDPTLLITGAPEGNIVLKVSKDARVELFPRTANMEIEFVLYNNTKPLLAQLDAQRPQFLTDAFAGSSGGGTWFMTLYVSRTDVVASWRKEEDNTLIITLKKGQPVLEEPRGIYTLDELLTEPPQRRPGRPPRLVVHPLTGDARTILVKADEYPLSSHHWKPLLGQLDRGRDLIISKTPTIYDVDRYRYVMATTRSQETKAVAMYQMGRTYEDLALYREAAYYYRSVVDQEAPFPANKLHMAQARVALAINDWENARKHCKNAYETGAGELATLECLALIARGTGSPSPSDVGRTLASKTDKPLAHLLAAELMLMDHMFVEAVELLRPLPELLRGQHARIANAHLGDGLFYTGDYEGARDAWRDVGPHGEVGGIVQQRQRVLRLLQSPPQKWPDFFPEFHVESRDYSPKSAEIHYALSQLGQALGDSSMAVEHLHVLLDRHHNTAYKSDVVERLESVCSIRLKQLHKDQEWVKEAAFYQECWRPELNRVLYNTDMMQDVVIAYLELGLWQAAYDLQLDINAIYTRDNEDNLEGLAQLARVHIQKGMPVEALETVTFARARPESTPYRRRLDYLEGRAHFKMNALDKAETAFQRASTDPEVGKAASLWMNYTRAEAMRCAEAEEGLRAFHQNPENIQSIDLLREDVLLAYSRCLIELGRPTEAVQLAKEITLMTDEPIYKEQAGYISTLASYRNASNTDAPNQYKVDPFWQQMIDVRQATQKVEDRARGKTSSLTPP